MNRDRLAFMMYQLLCYYARRDSQPRVLQPGRRRFWTAREDANLRLLYPNEEDATLQAIFQRSRTQIYARASTLGLHKSAEYMRVSRAQPPPGCCEALHKRGYRAVSYQHENPRDRRSPAEALPAPTSPAQPRLVNGKDTRG